MKASEHFDLPLSCGCHASISERVYEDSACESSEFVAEFNTPEQAMIAARAINHADKLADALTSMLVEHSKHQFPTKVSLAAALVLEAYRGAE